ncbi:MAG TPA: sigma 54-interacting transcriptional regulator [Bacillota bacterium]|nr:sigma 54-interacting transcriptional regulator [Bacillota bacterium]
MDEKGSIEYFNIGYLDFFDLKPQELIGKKVPQLYANLDENTSTLMRAVNRGEEFLNYVQELKTSRGRIIRQESDTLCIRDGDRVVGAIEFDFFDENKDVIYDNLQKSAEYKPPRITLDDVVGQCFQMRDVRKRLEKVINLDSPLLLMGETGTGKEMTARAIHNCSKRSKYDFVYINCNALPENLLEGILFGTRKGSFTDAKEKDGLFKIADRGTLFLDEIDSMPLSVQGKLLKCIEEKRIRPVGGEDEIPVDVRVIGSCKTPITALINGSRIRKDLYFRLSVIQFELLPLRERPGDPLLIADYYIRHFNRIFNKDIKGLDKEAEQFFLEYQWPGNIRELRNIIEYAFQETETPYITCQSIYERMDMDEKAAGQGTSTAEEFLQSGVSLKEYMEGLEKGAIEKTLLINGEDLEKTAADLGITRQVLKYKIAKYK